MSVLMEEFNRTKYNNTLENKNSRKINQSKREICGGIGKIKEYDKL